MPKSEHIFKVAVEWAVKADHDFIAASQLLKMGAGCPTDVVCFHAAQCVEKYMKCSWVCHSLNVPKTHDIERLVGLLPSGKTKLRLSLEKMRLLTEYATNARYPGVDDPSFSEASEALGIAKSIRKSILSTLPPEVRKLLSLE